MNGEHPWLDWLRVLTMAAIGIALVWVIVKILVTWAHKDDEKKK